MSFCLQQRRKGAKFQKNKIKSLKYNENSIKSSRLSVFVTNNFKKKQLLKPPKILVFGSRRDDKYNNLSGFLRESVFR